MGKYLPIDFRCHQAGPESLAPAAADLRFQVPIDEGMEDVEGQKGDQQETRHGIGFVFENMIGMPAIHQLVEAMILDVPALVAQGHDSRHPGQWRR